MHLQRRQLNGRFRDQFAADCQNPSLKRQSAGVVLKDKGKRGVGTINGGRRRRVTLWLKVVLPALLISSTPAVSADWRLLGIRQTRYGTSLTFIDVWSIKGSNGNAGFAASTYFSRKTAGMNRVNVAATANCSTMTYRFDQIDTFFNQRPLQSWLARPIQVAVRNTNVFDEIGSVCGMRDFGSHVEDPGAYARRYFLEHGPGK
jgi:hypothetical protein